VDRRESKAVSKKDMGKGDKGDRRKGGDFVKTRDKLESDTEKAKETGRLNSTLQ